MLLVLSPPSRNRIGRDHRSVLIPPDDPMVQTERHTQHTKGHQASTRFPSRAGKMPRPHRECLSTFWVVLETLGRAPKGTNDIQQWHPQGVHFYELAQASQRALPLRFPLQKEHKRIEHRTYMAWHN